MIGAMALTALAGASCSPAPPPVAGARDQLDGLRELRSSVDLGQVRFSNLLGFELPDDAVFVVPSDGPADRDSTIAHTGKSSLRFPPGTRHAEIRLPSLVAGREFPGNWTLVGGYLRAERPCAVTIDAGTLRRTVRLAPAEWTPVFLDITQLPAGNAPELTLGFSGPSQPIWLDDVLLIDNSRVFFAEHGVWSIRQRGFSLVGVAASEWRFALPTIDRPGGYEVMEVNRLRATFRSGDGSHVLAVFPDGRAYRDGAYAPYVAQPADRAFIAQQRSPAGIEIDESLGRIAGNTPGDANNDGYNETLAAYEIVAFASRIEFILEPRGSQIDRAMIHIRDLPQGEVLVTAEGQLVTSWERAGDGSLLIELPMTIQRPTTISVGVK
jgi:hypothetical protein